MITGKFITLKPFDAEDSENSRDWFNSPSASDYLKLHHPFNELEHQQWYEKISTDKTFLFFSIYSNISKSRMGCVWIEHIDMIDGKAEIFLLASKKLTEAATECTEAVDLFVKYIFEFLNINKIYCSVPTENISLRDLFLRSSFETEAILKQEFYRGGTYRDVFRMASFRTQSKQTMQQPQKSKDNSAPPEIQWFQSARTSRRL